MTVTDYSTIFDASPDALFILDSKGRIRNANQSAVQRYGYSLEELGQMDATDLAALELKSKVLPHLQKSLVSGDQFEWRHRRKDGSELPVEIYTRPFIHQGELAVLSCVRDITRRKRAEILLDGQSRV